MSIGFKGFYYFRKPVSPEYDFYKKKTGKNALRVTAAEMKVLILRVISHLSLPVFSWSKHWGKEGGG